MANKHGSHLLHAFPRGWGSSSIKVHLVIHITPKNSHSRHLDKCSDIWQLFLHYLQGFLTKLPFSLALPRHSVSLATRWLLRTCSS